MRTVDTVAAETDVQSAVSPRIAWFSVTILLLVAIMSYLDRQIISLMVEPIKASLGVSDFEIGLLQGVAFGLFYAVFGLPIGWLVDRYSRRKIIYFGMTLWSLAAGACGLASTYTHLLLARFGVGVGEASLSPAAYSMIADLFPPRRLALALGVFATGSSIGGALAYMAGGRADREVRGDGCHGIARCRRAGAVAAGLPRHRAARRRHRRPDVPRSRAGSPAPQARP
ncbi:MFS transporter [Sphingomonas sp. J315]|uniref:MFS transporter n=1 Tax=Sphingomonas sp. J315 TaxID=2898433 RepID=UPI0039173B8D